MEAQILLNPVFNQKDNVYQLRVKRTDNIVFFLTIKQKLFQFILDTILDKIINNPFFTVQVHYK